MEARRQLASLDAAYVRTSDRERNLDDRTDVERSASLRQITQLEKQLMDCRMQLEDAQRLNASMRAESNMGALDPA